MLMNITPCDTDPVLPPEEILNTPHLRVLAPVYSTRLSPPQAHVSASECTTLPEPVVLLKNLPPSSPRTEGEASAAAMPALGGPTDCFDHDTRKSSDGSALQTANVFATIPNATNTSMDSLIPPRAPALGQMAAELPSPSLQVAHPSTPHDPLHVHHNHSSYALACANLTHTVSTLAKDGSVPSGNDMAGLVTGKDNANRTSHLLPHAKGDAPLLPHRQVPYLPSPHPPLTPPRHSPPGAHLASPASLPGPEGSYSPQRLPPSNRH